MRTLLTLTTALVLGLTANSLAIAGGKGNSGGKGSSPSQYSPGSKQSSGTKNVSLSYPKLDKHYAPKDAKFHKTDKHVDLKTNKYKDYHLKHGKKLGKNGYCYPGKYHNHWQYCCFNLSFGCYLYCCPCTNCWYYYCVPDCCYYPVWYVPYWTYSWGPPVSYCSAPSPPAEVVLPEPVEVIDPTE